MSYALVCVAQTLAAGLEAFCAMASPAPLQHTSSYSCSNQHPPHQAFTLHCARPPNRVPWLLQVLVPHPLICALALQATGTSRQNGRISGCSRGAASRDAEARAPSVWILAVRRVWLCGQVRGSCLGHQDGHQRQRQREHHHQ